MNPGTYQPQGKLGHPVLGNGGVGDGTQIVELPPRAGCAVRQLRNKSSSSRVRCTGFPQRRMRSRFRMERERSLQWGFNDQIDTSPILFKKVRLQGSGVGAVQIAEAMARTIAALKLKSVIAEIFGFEQAKDALVKLQDSKGRESGPVQSSCLRAVEARRVLHHRRPRRRRSGHE